MDNDTARQGDRYQADEQADSYSQARSHEVHMAQARIGIAKKGHEPGNFRTWRQHPNAIPPFEYGIATGQELDITSANVRYKRSVVAHQV